MVVHHAKVLDTYGKDMDFKFLEAMQRNRVRENYLIEFKGNFYLHPQNNELRQKQLYDLSKRIAGFANTEGGFIFFGISEKNYEIRDLEGCDHDITADIKRVILHLQPVPQIEIYPPIQKPTDEKKFFYILEVFKSNRPTMIYTKDHPRKGAFPIRIYEETTVADLKHVEMLFYSLGEGQRKEKLLKALIETIKSMFSAPNNVVMVARFERFRSIARKLNGTPFLSIVKDSIYILDKYLIFPRKIIDFSEVKSVNSDTDPSILTKFSSEFREYIKERYNIYLDNIFD